MLTAPRADFPVSVSPGFYDGQDKLLSAKDYDVVGSFSLARRYLTLSRFSPTLRLDLSDTLVSLRRFYGGDAITNMRVVGEGTRLDEDWLSCVGCLSSPLTLGFLIPVQVQVKITGDVVKVKAPRGK
jgi:hypothetical protein